MSQFACVEPVRKGFEHVAIRGVRVVVSPECLDIKVSHDHVVLNPSPNAEKISPPLLSHRRPNAGVSVCTIVGEDDICVHVESGGFDKRAKGVQVTVPRG